MRSWKPILGLRAKINGLWLVPCCAALCQLLFQLPIFFYTNRFNENSQRTLLTLVYSKRIRSSYYKWCFSIPNRWPSILFEYIRFIPYGAENPGLLSVGQKGLRQEPPGLEEPVGEGLRKDETIAKARTYTQRGRATAIPL